MKRIVGYLAFGFCLGFAHAQTFCAVLLQALPIVKQIRTDYCGPASLDSALRSLGVWSPGQAVLGRELNCGGDYLYAGNLAARAKQSGLWSKLDYQKSLYDLAVAVSRQEVCIVAYVLGGVDHYSGVQAMTDSDIYLMDPWPHVGENPFVYRRIPLAEFLAMWWPAKYYPAGGTLVRLGHSPIF